jgi:hypothetical protein
MEPGLTICIAAYQYPARPLLDSLYEALPGYSAPVTVLVGNDGSGQPWESEYAFLPADYSQLRLVQAAQNLGRVGIRNKLAHEATTEWLLFIDVDSEIGDAEYLAKYERAGQEADIVVGGTRYTLDQIGAGSLRHRYGLAKEMVPAAKRALAPYSQLTLNNLYIRRATFFAAGGLDRAITTYGHEDTLLGKKLERIAARIVHIDNAVIHTGLEADEVFIQKSEEAARGLARIYQAGKLAPSDARLIAAANMVARFGGRWVVQVGLLLFPSYTLVGLDLLKLNAYLGQMATLKRDGTAKRGDQPAA